MEPSLYEPLDHRATGGCAIVCATWRRPGPGLGRDIFSQVLEVKFTVYFCLIGIGEALSEVPRAALASEPSIPWGSIIGMRNRLLHAYWRIDDEIVYEVATLKLPAVGTALDRMIRNFKAT